MSEEGLEKIVRVKEKFGTAYKKEEVRYNDQYGVVYVFLGGIDHYMIYRWIDKQMRSILLSRGKIVTPSDVIFDEVMYESFLADIIYLLDCSDEEISKYIKMTYEDMTKRLFQKVNQ